MSESYDPTKLLSDDNFINWGNYIRSKLFVFLLTGVAIVWHRQNSTYIITVRDVIDVTGIPSNRLSTISLMIVTPGSTNTEHALTTINLVYKLTILLSYLLIRTAT
jgi:hypothetical protein